MGERVQEYMYLLLISTLHVHVIGVSSKSREVIRRNYSMRTVMLCSITEEKNVKSIHF